MNKLILILLFFPMIGFGQEYDSRSIYFNSSFIISDTKSSFLTSSVTTVELPEGTLIPTTFENSSKIYFGIGYNFYNSKILGFDFEINYLIKSLQFNKDNFRGIDDNGMLAIGELISKNKANIISFSINNTLELISFSSLRLYFTLAPRIDVTFAENYSSTFTSYNLVKGNPQRETSTSFNKIVYGSDLGFGIQRSFNKLVIKSNFKYGFNFTEILDVSNLLLDINKEINNNNFILSLSIGRYI